MDAEARGELFHERAKEWAQTLAPAVVRAVRESEAVVLLAPMGMAPVAHLVAAETGVPWVIVNGSFYIGPDSPRRLEEDFSPTIVSTIRYFRATLDTASLVLHGTWSVFDYGHANLPENHHYVGPLMWEPPPPVPTYIDQPSDPWVLVTLSSLTQNDVPLAQAALDALADRPVRTLVTVGHGRSSADLSSIPGNAWIETYVPHTAVLQRGILCISHGGAGAVMKALWHGVPLVLAPWGGLDRPGVAARAERLGVARVIPSAKVASETLVQIIDEVVTGERYREAAERVSHELRRQDPIRTACSYVEVLKEKVG
jgi:MGT family glycosyltransferase